MSVFILRIILNDFDLKRALDPQGKDLLCMELVPIIK